MKKWHYLLLAFNFFLILIIGFNSYLRNNLTSSSKSAVLQSTTSTSISGIIFIDSNRNGTQDSGESGYFDTSMPRNICLSENGSTRICTYVISMSGYYDLGQWSNSAAFTYAVTFTVPSGYTATTPTTVNVTSFPATINFGIAPQTVSTSCTGTITYTCGTASSSNNYLSATWNITPVNGINSCNVWIQAAGSAFRLSQNNECSGQWSGNTLPNTTTNIQSDGIYGLYLSNGNQSGNCYNVMASEARLNCATIPTNTPTPTITPSPTTANTYSPNNSPTPTTGYQQNNYNPQSTPTPTTAACPSLNAPSMITPNGNISSGERKISWGNVSGAEYYSLRIDDLENGWTDDCSIANSGDICTDYVSTNSYSYNFKPGHSYKIWVHARNDCDAWGSYIYSNVDVTSVFLTPTPTQESSISPTPTGVQTTFYYSMYADIKKDEQFINPSLVLPLSNSILSGNKKIEIKGQKGSSLDVQLESLSDKGEKIFLKKVYINEYGDNVTFDWDTTNTPDGEYRLFAASLSKERGLLIAGPRKIIIKNNQQSSAGNIIYPSKFDPNKALVDKKNEVTDIKNIKSEENKEGLALKMEGKALPNTIITLLIYSQPIVVTVKTDSNGTWTYTLDKPLQPGKHQVYVAVPGSNNSIVRSEVSQFFIAPGFAASANNESLIVASAPEDSFLQRFMFITGGIILASVLILTILFFLKLNKSINTT